MFRQQLFTILFVCCIFYGPGQSITGSFYNTVNLKSGYYFPDHSRFNDHPFSEISERLRSPVELISISIDHGRGKEGQIRYGEMGLTYFFNRSKSGDSSILNWFASNGYVTYKWDLFSNKEWIDVGGGIGPMMGSQWLIIMKEGNRTLHRNFFAALAPSFFARVQLGKRFATGFDLTYFFDFTDSLWKGKKQETFQVSKSSFTGTQASIFIGFVM